MKYLPIIGLTIVLVGYADLAVAKTPAEIESISRAVTVEIALLKDKSIGSGVIIERRGDLYTLITNRHVACGRRGECTTPPAAETYTLKLGDGQQYKVAAKSVKILGGNLDLAIVQFRSNRAYPVAQVAEPGSLKVGDKVFTSGYPATPPGFSFNAGSAISVVDKRLTGDRGGYTVIYDAETQPGMSGGGVFNEAGRLVAVHGQGERYRDNTELTTMSSSGVANTTKQEVGSKIGYNRGIPVRWVVQGLAERGIRSGNRQPVNLGQTRGSSADEHFITGFNKLVEPGADILAGKQLAVSEFSQAIRLNPRYTSAYFMRAFANGQLQNDRQALADYNRVIQINPNSASAYNNRGNLKKKLNDVQGALADYNRAIQINPNDPLDYSNRGNLKFTKLNDVQGALADYNRAIQIDPNFAYAYYNRGTLKDEKLNDNRGALADYDRAIQINPNYAVAYGNRGNLKEYKLNDTQGALADYDRSIQINPNDPLDYYNRGLLKKNKLNDNRGALADYDWAIQISPNYANAHYNRGYLKYTKLNDIQGALADLNQAAKLYQQQGNTQKYQQAIDLLRQWGQPSGNK